MRPRLHLELARALRFAPALALVGACALRSPEWPAILAEVRRAHPTVPLISVEELAAKPAEQAPLLLDARGPDEFAQSHLANAVSAPDEEAALAALRGVQPARAIVVYCSVGMRSGALAEKLRARGFTDVANLEGGIFAWANSGRPTWRGVEREDRVHPFDARWGALLAPERRAE